MNKIEMFNELVRILHSASTSEETSDSDLIYSIMKADLTSLIEKEIRDNEAN